MLLSEAGGAAGAGGAAAETVEWGSDAAAEAGWEGSTMRRKPSQAKEDDGDAWKEEQQEGEEGEAGEMRLDARGRAVQVNSFKTRVQSAPGFSA